MFGGGGSDLVFFKNREEGSSFPIQNEDDKPVDPSNIGSLAMMKSESDVEAFEPVA